MIAEITVQKTFASDFEKIYPLLLTFDSPYKREDWIKIFNYQWSGTQDHIGYHLEKQGQVIGFMGLIFSIRKKNNNHYTFCNITSLIVKPEYRTATVLLLRKLNNYKETIFTCLAPIPESYRLMTTLGFRPFENFCKIIPVVNGLFFKAKKICADTSRSIVNKLDDENKRIFLDHQNFKCESILFEYYNEIALLIYTIQIQKHISITVTKIHLHYSSNIIFFNKKIRVILNYFRKKYGFFSALYVDKRWVSHHCMMFTLNRKINPAKIRSKQFVGEVDVDSLYSEVVLL